jgi:NADH-quinone oxidoreductase subunit L
VGLCSYLLIGFWYRDPVNGLAARKAFIVTRIGDTAMVIGLFLLFTNLGTLRIQDLMQRASMQWTSGSALAIAAAALLLGGAVGKSAQLPLQTWLPDAMAGPTPTSALIHAATMVTAGVYLIARTHTLFQLAPQVQFIVAIIGAATLLLSGFSALAQSDIKRVLAYSTISQIGYMFLALGVGAWTAAVFHFMTHAFFKALLFLAAGIVINALHHEHDMFRMGGLRRDLPIAFWAFLVGGCALAGLPLVTSGAYSKDLILWDELSSPSGATSLWAAGIAGVFLTSLYIFRLIFLVFFGRRGTEVTRRPGFAMQLPVWILAALTIAAGFPQRFIIGFLATALPGITDTARGVISEAGSGIIAGLTFAAGLLVAVFLYLRPPIRQSSTSALQRLWLTGWGFDSIYDRLFVRPVVWI